MKRDRLLMGIGIFTAIVPSAYFFLSVTYLFAATLFSGIVAIWLAFAPPKAIRRVVGIGLCVVATMGSFSLIAYGRSSGPPIKLVIPNDYVGEIRIQLDETDGIPPERTSDYWVYHIGDDGTLLTSNDRPFYRWHQTRAEFRDGRVILDFDTGTYQNHGYRITGGGTSETTGDPGPTHHWTLERTNANKAVEATADQPSS